MEVLLSSMGIGCDGRSGAACRRRPESWSWSPARRIVE